MHVGSMDAGVGSGLMLEVGMRRFRRNRDEIKNHQHRISVWGTPQSGSVSGTNSGRPTSKYGLWRKKNTYVCLFLLVPFSLTGTIEV